MPVLSFEKGYVQEKRGHLPQSVARKQKMIKQKAIDVPFVFLGGLR